MPRDTTATYAHHLTETVDKLRDARPSPTTPRDTTDNRQTTIQNHGNETDWTDDEVQTTKNHDLDDETKDDEAH